MKNIVVPVKNISRLLTASSTLLSRTPGTPGMGLIYGRSGYGKTTATAWFVNQCNGVYIRALSTWTATSMLKNILKELALDATRSRCADMVEQIVDNLKLTGRPLFIDEFDYLVENKKMTETLRDIHDMSSVPIILIGMAGVERKVQVRDQFVNRIAQWVEFQPADYKDACELCNQLCEVDIADDLLRKLYHTSGGVIRLIVIGLDAIERKAKVLGKKNITSVDWGKADFFLSDSPSKKKKRGGI